MMAIIETKTISKILGLREKDVRKRRIKLGVVECWCAVPVSGKEDTYYYYYYSTYNAKDETVASNNPKKVMILGGRGMEVLSDKESLSEQAIETGKGFAKLGFKILAIEGTVLFYEKAGVSCEVIAKIGEGRPNVLDVIVNNQVSLVINTPWPRRDAVAHESAIRQAAIKYKIPYITTLAAVSNTDDLQCNYALILGKKGLLFNEMWGGLRFFYVSCFYAFFLYSFFILTFLVVLFVVATA